MNLIKHLQWEYRGDGVIYSEPVGLKWAYYIEQLEDGEFELALIDDYGHWNEGLITIHASLSEAQIKAQSIHEKILMLHLLG